MSTILDWLASQQFNALRIPFSAELAEAPEARVPTNINYGANPELQGMTSGQVMDRCVPPLPSSQHYTLASDVIHARVMPCCGAHPSGTPAF